MRLMKVRTAYLYNSLDAKIKAQFFDRFKVPNINENDILNI